MMDDVEDPALREALDALHHACAAYRAQRPTWSIQPAVLDRLGAAWANVKSLVPDEFVISLEDVAPCDPGAPMPMVVSDGGTTWLTYHFTGDSDDRSLVTFRGVDSVLYARLRHFVFTFHDETFECIASSYVVSATESTHPAALLTQQRGDSVRWSNPGLA